MITFKTGNKKINVPQMWSEITLKQWHDVTAAGADQDKIIAAITGLPEDVVVRLSAHSRRLVAESTRFLSKFFNSEEWIVPKVVRIGDHVLHPKFDIREKEYGQRIVLQTAAEEKGRSFIGNLSTLIEIYLQPLITKKYYDPERTEEVKALIEQHVLFVDAYTLAVYYCKQLNEIIATEAATLNVQPTAEQRMAGIDEYSKFGVMNTIRALAGGDILKANEVLHIDYSTVYSWLLMNKTDSTFNTKYSQVLQNKYAGK
jgi:hypothetical protein